jgi:hypothetical protein
VPEWAEATVPEWAEATVPEWAEATVPEWAEAAVPGGRSRPEAQFLQERKNGSSTVEN